ncbi:hypothetical protein J6590_081113 [Homalodisca vitripennis]|nr:hypothetical protein J6590_091480 [Homalodisca vitripennis]KAG8290442.1 hypothetical protein J6590_081113 [Homalodisca vitripennis]
MHWPNRPHLFMVWGGLGQYKAGSTSAGDKVRRCGGDKVTLRLDGGVPAISELLPGLGENNAGVTSTVDYQLQDDSY